MDDNEITPGCKIPVNAHAPIKDGTIFSHDRVFVCTGKNDSKTQRVDVDFFEKKKKSPFSNKHVDSASMLFCCFQVVFKIDIVKIWIGTDLMGFTTQIRPHDPNSIHRVAKGFSVTRDWTQIISVMRDRAQISRVSRDWA